MIAINDAWRVLVRSGQTGRLRRLVVRDGAHSSPVIPQPPPAAAGGRRHAWVAGVQAQVIRLSSLAGSSSVQTLLLRAPRAERAVYDALVEQIVRGPGTERPRLASGPLRAAGAAPLDLGVASTLVGIRALADGVRRQSSLGLSPELMMTAELLDRMWDVLAHELPITLSNALGWKSGCRQADRSSLIPSTMFAGMDIGVAIFPLTPPCSRLTWPVMPRTAASSPCGFPSTRTSRSAGRRRGVVEKVPHRCPTTTGVHTTSSSLSALRQQ